MDKSYEEIRIPVPWGHISGKWWGCKDEQPIIALHALQENCGSFDPIVPLLSAESILCLDLPGHGLSSHLPKGQCYYVVWDGVLYLRRILKHFKWQKYSDGQVKLLGHCMGGEIACLYAAIYPDDVEYVINLDGVISVAYLLGGEQTGSKLIPEMGLSIDKFLLTESFMENKNRNFAYKNMIDIAYDAYDGGLSYQGAKVLMRRGMKPTKKSNQYNFTRDPSLKTLNVMLFNWAVISLELALDFASKIRCPYLNIKASPGNNLDENIYNSLLEEIRKASSKFVLHEVKGSHHVHINEPEKIAPLINDFIKSYK